MAMKMDGYERWMDGWMQEHTVVAWGRVKSDCH